MSTDEVQKIVEEAVGRLGAAYETERRRALELAATLRESEVFLETREEAIQTAAVLLRLASNLLSEELSSCSSDNSKLPPEPKTQGIIGGGGPRTSPMGLVAGAIEAAWSRETSSDSGNWTPENPAWGQCAVTALLIQDLFGGVLRRCLVNGTSHYWNEFSESLPPGFPTQTTIDLTLRQFGEVIFKTGDFREVSRKYVLSFPATRERYELLKQLVREQLQ